MTATHLGDEALTWGLAGWLRARFGMTDPFLTNLRRPTSGYASETVFFDVTWTEEAGERVAPGVIRMAPSTDGVFAHYDLGSQWQAQMAAAASGVPVADPVLETDPRWLGGPFVAMRRVEGHIVGSLIHRDRWLSALGPDEQARVHRNFLDVLATIHRAELAGIPGVPHRNNEMELDFWGEYLIWSSGGSPVPVLVDALSWCRRNRPAEEPPPVLLWGDARFENAILGDDLSVLAVLDWDMTSIGAPEHDLAWFTGLDLTMHRLFGERVPGFPDRAATVALFEEISGRSVSDLEWYETLAMVRSTAIMTRIGYLQRNAGRPVLLPIEDNPILDLLAERLR